MDTIKKINLADYILTGGGRWGECFNQIVLEALEKDCFKV